MTDSFNPLDIKNLGDSLQRAILSSEPISLENLPMFRGVGIYAIYYVGYFPSYELLAEANRDGSWEQPIYVGKAEPKGGRKGVLTEEASDSTALQNRLRAHGRSIRSVENLYLSDFYARYLVVEPVWVPLGESVLINRFGPVWNTIVDGFGSNAAGVGRFAGMRSRWDTLHPGRPAAESLASREEDAEEIAQDVWEYLRQRMQV
ncbi:Eco29kI family restriction endonuclease [Modestobacter versicolor]|uniref:Restriction endonuclease n=1 Tax=Modestobacter versicolor TaxID=429133 RepID=A0A323VEC8_9ACTN|nr:Eco29kI family restriction endonuclease [Modestobacter versicolor]MBB3674363.1 hypothetical protein [Modestobacter versicolor]PZA23097.1 restriction endonuclease [Modestobacter versicolor]